MLPSGMYLDKTLKVTKQELLQETDYIIGKFSLLLLLLFTLASYGPAHLKNSQKIRERKPKEI